MLPPSHGADDKRFAGLALPDLAIGLALALSILLVYAQVARFDFINFDDDLYFSKNTIVQAGLTGAGLKWATTAVVSANWAPVTLLSYMLDAQLFGVNVAELHLINVVYHAIAAILLFVLLQRATHSRGPSAFVAFIFALHPLHVESVAWISERKDVLSALFFFLALYAYVRYAEQPGVGRYLLMLAPFCLGLMSKSMLVTFPFVLLLFDFWPLRRVGLPKLLWEKAPLVALSAAVSAVSYSNQLATGALVAATPLDARIFKALISYITYLRQTFWPAGLAVFYPYPRYIFAKVALQALAILMIVSLLVILERRTRPYLATGWFWYLGTLVPVIGFVKIGDASHADRYTYIPMVGLSIMLAWGAADFVARWPRSRLVIGGAAAACCVACLALAARQTSYWQDNETLFTHAIAVTGDNWLAEANLGAHLMHQPGRSAESLEHLQNALRIKPEHAESSNNVGLLFAQIDDCRSAIPYFEAALVSRPDLVEADNNLGMCLVNLGDYQGAVWRLESVLRVRPDYADAHLNLGRAFEKIPGRELDGVAQYEAGLRLKPDNVYAHRLLGLLLLRLGRNGDATLQFEAAEQILPDERTEQILRGLRKSP